MVREQWSENNTKRGGGRSRNTEASPEIPGSASKREVKNPVFLRDTQQESH
jgi:hypothetical protein